jgi:hypothetical protein
MAIYKNPRARIDIFGNISPIKARKKVSSAFLTMKYYKRRKKPNPS